MSEWLNEASPCPTLLHPLQHPEGLALPSDPKCPPHTLQVDPGQSCLLGPLLSCQEVLRALEGGGVMGDRQPYAQPTLLEARLQDSKATALASRELMGC